MVRLTVHTQEHEQHHPQAKKWPYERVAPPGLGGMGGRGAMTGRYNLAAAKFDVWFGRSSPQLQTVSLENLGTRAITSIIMR